MRAQTSHFAKSAARSLRSNMTDAEIKLWHRLRGKQLGSKFRRQHPFENYILDFVCLDKYIVIEVDGSQHAAQAAHDTERTAKLNAAGFTVLRFWNNEVLENMDEVVEVIWNVLNRSTFNPSPP